MSKLIALALAAGAALALAVPALATPGSMQPRLVRTIMDAKLGEVLTRWIRDNPNARILDKIVTQSSDSEFHCLTITIFYEMQTQ